MARATTDRVMLRTFLERDRLFAAYALCDLDDREFRKTRWGVATDRDEPVAVALEYAGLTPQPLFVIGRPDGVSGDTAGHRPARAALVAARTEALPAVSASYKVDGGPPMLRMWVDRTTFRPVPGQRRQAPAGRDRRPEPPVPARLRVVAALVGHRRRRLLRHPCQRQARRRLPGRMSSADARARRRRQCPDPRRPTAAGATPRRRPARSPPTCCGSATRSCSTSGPTIHPRIAAYRRLGSPEYVRFEERLDPSPRIAARRTRRAVPTPFSSHGSPTRDDPEPRRHAAARRHRPRPRGRRRPADRVGGARDARPAPHPRALRARAAHSPACASAPAST